MSDLHREVKYGELYKLSSTLDNGVSEKDWWLMTRMDIRIGAVGQPQGDGDWDHLEFEILSFSAPFKTNPMRTKYPCPLLPLIHPWGWGAVMVSFAIGLYFAGDAPLQLFLTPYRGPVTFVNNEIRFELQPVAMKDLALYLQNGTDRLAKILKTGKVL